ncbi:hypothetical protein GCM10009839_13290 [Catenulispora yoronensis]|uniref:Uncharacterized protein n=1 Tax=Catenulispora yoronensis TaxID=450799 RepID=A0ABP5F6F9_9ACTN
MHGSKIGGGIAIAAALVLAAVPAASAIPAGAATAATAATVAPAAPASADAAPTATGWTAVSAPPQGQNAFLVAAASTADADAWAVGSQGGAATTNLGSKVLIDHWNGSAWTQATAPAIAFPTAGLDAVSASGPNDAWAVGQMRQQRYQFNPLALHWNGSAWSPVSISVLGSTTVVGVADISPTDAYAFGTWTHDGQAAHWDGTAWTNFSPPQPDNNNMGGALTAISADGPDDVWMTGSALEQIGANAYQYEPYSVHWNGSAWSLVPMPTVGSSNVNAVDNLYGLKANSPTDVWAVGTAGVIGTTGSYSTLIEHWNGTVWTKVPSPNTGTDPLLHAVTTANAANSVWAVGDSVIPGTTQRQSLTLHWNGSTWSIVPSPNAPGLPTTLSGVTTTPGASIVHAVGYSNSLSSTAPVYNPFAMRNG